MKIFASWILVATGGLLSAIGLVMFGIFIYRELRMRFGPRTLSLDHLRPTVPEAMGIDVPWLRFDIMTDTWVFLIGLLGVGLLILAIGLHLHVLHRLDGGRASDLSSSR